MTSGVEVTLDTLKELYNAATNIYAADDRVNAAVDAFDATLNSAVQDVQEEFHKWLGRLRYPKKREVIRQAPPIPKRKHPAIPTETTLSAASPLPAPALTPRPPVATPTPLAELIPAKHLEAAKPPDTQVVCNVNVQAATKPKVKHEAAPLKKRHPKHVWLPLDAKDYLRMRTKAKSGLRANWRLMLNCVAFLEYDGALTTNKRRLYEFAEAEADGCTFEDFAQHIPWLMEGCERVGNMWRYPWIIEEIEKYHRCKANGDKSAEARRHSKVSAEGRA